MVKVTKTAHHRIWPARILKSNSPLARLLSLISYIGSRYHLLSNPRGDGKARTYDSLIKSNSLPTELHLLHP